MKMRINTSRNLPAKNDISIIGGSSAGFFTAYLLARQGLPVSVFEEKKHPCNTKRTIIVTNHIQRVIGGLCKDFVVNKIHRFELFTDGHCATVSLKRPDLVIESSKLKRVLQKKAEKHGAKIFFDHRFLNLNSNGNKLNFTISNNDGRSLIQKSTNVLVGADGAFSKVAHYGGWPKPNTAPLIQARVKLPGDLPPDTTRVWFIQSDTNNFYWLIPHSQTEGVLGLIAKDEENGRKSLEQFLEKKRLSPIDFQSARIPIYSRWIPLHRQVRKSHIYLAGDAAAHVKVTTVGGLLTGFKGAIGIAEAILNGGSSKKLKALKRELDRHKFIRKLLHGYTQADYIRLFDLLTPPVKRSLSEFSRDETDKLLLNLLLRQPQFFLLAARFFLSNVWNQSKS